MKYSYEIIDEKSYYILKDGKKMLYQYEPAIPYRGKTIAESAQNHVNSLLIEVREKNELEKDNAQRITDLELAMVAMYEGGLK